MTRKISNPQMIVFERIIFITAKPNAQQNFVYGQTCSHFTKNVTSPQDFTQTVKYKIIIIIITGRIKIIHIIYKITLVVGTL